MEGCINDQLLMVKDVLDLELKTRSKSDPNGIPDRLVVHRKGIAPAQGQDALAYSLHTSPRAHQVLRAVGVCCLSAVTSSLTLVSSNDALAAGIIVVLNRAVAALNPGMLLTRSGSLGAKQVVRAGRAAQGRGLAGVRQVLCAAPGQAAGQA